MEKGCNAQPQCGDADQSIQLPKPALLSLGDGYAKECQRQTPPLDPGGDEKVL
jgi:hypothetical protein